MKLNLIKHCAMALLVVSSMACQSTTKPIVVQPVQSCEVTDNIALSAALDDVKAQLSTGKCNQHFSDYYTGLLDTAKGDPKAENKRLFNDFLAWSKQKHIISKVDAISYFTQYFGERFISLNNTYNTCSQGSEQNKIFAALDGEMSMKKTGILDVLGDKKTFNTVASQKQDLETVLEATWMACDLS